MESQAQTQGKVGGGAVQMRSGTRIAGVNINQARNDLMVAAMSLEPAERTQKRAFRALMPEIYLLRKRDYSFAQIVEMLAECCGFTIQPSTARGYFNEMILEKEAECLKRFDESVMVLAEYEKQTKSDSMKAFASQVINKREVERSRSRYAQKSDILQGAADISEVSQATTAVATSATAQIASGVAEPEKAAAAPPPSVENSKTGAVAPVLAKPSPTPEPVEIIAPPAAVAAGGSDLPQLEQPVTQKDNAVDEKTTINNIEIGSLRCGPLQPGTKQLKPFAGVPPEIYKEGSLEHPAVPGLILSLPERIYGAFLDIIDSNDVSRLENTKERMMRIKWQKPIPRTESVTGKNFVDINPAAFK